MEANPRPFERVKIGFTNVESAHERFHTDPATRVPAAAWWRVNLTALSQRHNLYFLATLDKIQVYIPSFPYQTLGRYPCLTISPRLANPSAEGYLDVYRPHAINHLILGDLGNQEILLCSTDSGNIVAYYTSAIQAVIERDVHKLSADGDAGFGGLRPFLSQWVNESAWGLSIHSEARMIAVSANTPHHVPNADPTSKITVFAFALTAPGKDSDEDDSDHEIETALLDERAEWRTWSASMSAITSDTPRRDCNYKITLAGPDGHKQNIPSVSFVNGSDDSNGAWLLSTDIHNQMKMWQIWKGKCYKTWTLSPRNTDPIPIPRPEDVGWFVAAINIDAFRPARNMDEFIGYHRVPEYYGYHAPGDSYDLTSIVRKLTPQNNTVHPIDGQVDSDTSEEEEDILVSDVDDADSEADIAVSHRLSATTFRSTAAVNSAVPPLLGNVTEPSLSGPAEGEISATSVSDESSIGSGDDHIGAFDEHLLSEPMDFESTDDPSENDEDSETDGEFMDPNEDDNSPNSSRSATSSTSYNPPQRDDNVEEQQNEYVRLTAQASTALQALSRKHKSSAKPVNSLIQTEQGDQVQPPQVPIIHCSTSHIRLYKGPTADYAHTICARPLWQTLPPGMESHRMVSMRRMSMVQQIPELGIIIIASQIGRCAVCSLTKRPYDGLPGFRVDWMLPTKRQERANARPNSYMLLGIATSPIQGRAESQTDASPGRTDGHDWTRVCKVDGTPTSFDSGVVPLDPCASSQKTSPQQLRDRGTNIQERRWQEPYQKEPWRPYESSRRYRLMMTYADQTVLTYEISRNVERGDKIPSLVDERY